MMYLLRQLEINNSPILRGIFFRLRFCCEGRIAGYVTVATKSKADKKASKVGELFVSSCLRACSRLVRAAVSYVWMERRNRSLHSVSEDFEHRPIVTGSGVGFKRVLKHAAFCWKLFLLSFLLLLNSPQINAELPFPDCPGPGCPSLTGDNKGIKVRNLNGNKNNISIYFQNLCANTVYAAINFENSLGEWKTEGWLVLKKGEKVLVAMTKNNLIYIYAESEAIKINKPGDGNSGKNVKLLWKGESKYFPIKKGEVKTGFFQKKIDNQNVDEWLEVFECDE